MTPRVGLSVMPETAFIEAAMPLFETGAVEAIEWSFDMSWRPGVAPWLAGLLADYSEADRLLGHGVSLSPLSNHARQERWYERFGIDAANHRFAGVSEHFGFMAAGDFALGPPLPVPLTTETLAIGRAHLQRMARVAGTRVGLENLALAFSADDVLTQGHFLDALLSPTDGYVVLDVHNLFCQLHNFGLDADRVLDTYPLDRVTECHISGGSWSIADGRTVRRDTHDDDIPREAFALLSQVLENCPNVETVIVERLGHTLVEPGAAARFRRDFHRVVKVVRSATQGAQQSPRAMTTVGALR